MDDKRRRKIKVKNSGQNVSVSHKWTITVTILAFTMTLLFSFITSQAENVGLASAVLMLVFIILLGILFDIIGMAVSTATEIPFHAMASKRIPGAKEAISIVRHAPQISSMCNDVIGDIAGIISGAMTTAIVVSCTVIFGIDQLYLNLLFSGAVAAFMIGGKAAGKGVAIQYNNTIVFFMGKIMCFIKYLNPFRKHG